MTGATAEEVWPLLRDHHYLGRRTADPMHVFAWREGGGLFGDFGPPLAAIVYTAPANKFFGKGAVELSRLVRTPEFEQPLSRFVAWSIRWLRANTPTAYVLSYADTGAGHHGGIYQALSFDYVAISAGNTQWRNPATDEVVSGRSFDQRRPAFREGWVRERSSPKHLYIKPVRERRAKLLDRFGWEPLPYPKPNCEIAPKGKLTRNA